MDFNQALYHLSRSRGPFHDALVQHALAIIQGNSKKRDYYMACVISMLPVGFDANVIQADVDDAKSLPLSSVDEFMRGASSKMAPEELYRAKCVFNATTRDLAFTYFLFLKSHKTTPSGCLYAASNLGAWLDAH